jgi:5-deoxy-D-glucuronate isomerase
MSYSWSNEKKLDTLQVSGNGNELLFYTPTEKARVILENNLIKRVIFQSHDNEVTIEESQCSHITVGSGNMCRDVYHFLKPKGPAPTMRLGLTRHQGKNTWSSLPHDFELNTEPGFEEVFFYMLEGGSQRAVQVGKGVWYDNSSVDGIWQVKDKTFCTIPMGYHPVVGEPNVQVSYVWAYLAKYPRWEKI